MVVVSTETLFFRGILSFAPGPLDSNLNRITGKAKVGGLDSLVKVGECVFGLTLKFLDCPHL